ncbi:sucrase-isomaltase, intestinal-like [Limulus polyphemus]|uniref:Maltase n=1 Tax=Limulus polyphemus TaxID=6850 RepID=A0ABM1T012_LIMPO|nr:sucrase-isomaltase, intestinal-like [Limulus polyphemus]
MTKTEWDGRNKFYVKKIRLKNALIGLIILLLLATFIAVPLAIIYWPQTPPLPMGEKDRIECPLSVPGNITECENRGCIWSEASAAPNCYMPKNIRRFNVTKTTDLPDGFKITLTYTGLQDVYSPSLPTVVFEVDYLNDNVVRFTFQDEAKQRYKVPVESEEFNVPQLRRKGNKNRMYEVVVGDYENSSFSFKIQRKNSTILWDTTIGGFVFEEQFLQIATYLPSENIYGFGENPHQSFRHDLNYQTWPLFARDEPPSDGNKNLYGVHPFYTCLENAEGKSHGVLLLNSNAMEYTLLPFPGLSYRTIGGILDFFMFIGDSPEHVIQLYTELIGRPMIPPYWALGFQLSRYGYENITNLQKAVERTRNAHIPLDVQYVDIDHMEDNKVFTVDSERFPDLDSYVQQEQKNGLRWIIILDPALLANDSNYSPYTSGLKNDKNVYITWPADVPLDSRKNPEDDGLDLTKDIIFGKVWPIGPVAFPDFLKPTTKQWWEEQIVKYRNKTEAVKFDGLWIDMNEPANFGTNREEPWYCSGKCWSLHCPYNEYDNPPYATGRKPVEEREHSNSLPDEKISNETTGTGYSDSPPDEKIANETTGTGYSDSPPDEKIANKTTGTEYSDSPPDEKIANKTRRQGDSASSSQFVEGN